MPWFEVQARGRTGRFIGDVDFASVMDWIYGRARRPSRVQSMAVKLNNGHCTTCGRDG